ncbi:transmembrane efflux protein [Anopheles sinensis]|uniref:Transmembrane efflux protein n=1 Tax=Anopheles sinensis TaxID=74873 RepID=A0A084W157_ANOSI|nr:transmembrane efflux protein [Anopheles sinensis]
MFSNYTATANDAEEYLVVSLGVKNDYGSEPAPSVRRANEENGKDVRDEHQSVDAGKFVFILTVMWHVRS